MNTHLDLLDSSLTADSSTNKISLAWTPQTLKFPGIDFSSVSIDVNADETVSLTGSGTFSVTLKSVSIPIPDGWQSGLGKGTMTCNLSLSGTIKLSTSNQKVTASLSKLSGTVMGLTLAPSDFSLEVTIDDLKNFSIATKNQIEQGSSNFFNTFWSQQLKTPKTSATERVEIVFDKLTLPVSTPVIAVKGFQKLTTDKSTIGGNFTCTWDLSGFEMSLNASVDILGKEVTLSETSKSTENLNSITGWIKGFVTPYYTTYGHAWLQEIGVWLHGLKQNVAQLFKNNNYLATDAIVAVDHARQSGAALDAQLLKTAGYDQSEIATALSKGLNQSISEFVEALKTGLGETDETARKLLFAAGYDYKTIGDYLSNAQCDAAYIATFFKNNGKSIEDALTAGLGTDYASIGRALHAAKYSFNEMIDGIKTYFDDTDINAVNAAIPGGYSPGEIGTFLRDKCGYDQGKIACFYRLHGDNGVNALIAVNTTFGKSSDDDATGLYNGGYSAAAIANAFRGAFSTAKGQPGAIHNIGETLNHIGFGQGNLDGLAGSLRDALKSYLPQGKKPKKGSVLPQPKKHPKHLKGPGGLGK